MNVQNQPNSNLIRLAMESFRRRIVDPFLFSEHPPWYDARGSALGLLVGFGFPLGLQWTSLALIRVVVKFNIVLALALTWVNNPLTVAPMYYVYYLIGSALIGSSSRVNPDTFHELMAPLFQAESFFDSLSGLADIGSDVLIRCGIGALVTGFFFGAMGYVVTYYIQTCRRQKRLMKDGNTKLE